MSAQWTHFPQSCCLHDWHILQDTRLCFSTLIFSLRPSSFVGEGLFRRDDNGVTLPSCENKVNENFKTEKLNITWTKKYQKWTKFK
jgi:hypothetical protein